MFRCALFILVLLRVAAVNGANVTYTPTTEIIGTSSIESVVEITKKQMENSTKVGNSRRSTRKIIIPTTKKGNTTTIPGNSTAQTSSTHITITVSSASAKTGENETTPETTSRIITEATTKITPKITSEITPTTTSQITPTMTSEITPTMTSEITPTMTSEITPTMTSEITPTMTSEITPTMTSEITPTTTSEITPTMTSEITPTTTSEITPTMASSVIPQTTSSTTEKMTTTESQPTYSATEEITKNTKQITTKPKTTQEAARSSEKMTTNRLPTVPATPEDLRLKSNSELKIPMKFKIRGKFDEGLSDEKSDLYRSFIETISQKLKPQFRKIVGFRRLDQFKLRKGSILVTFEAIFAAISLNQELRHNANFSLKSLLTQYVIRPVIMNESTVINEAHLDVSFNERNSLPDVVSICNTSGTICSEERKCVISSKDRFGGRCIRKCDGICLNDVSCNLEKTKCTCAQLESVVMSNCELYAKTKGINKSSVVGGICIAVVIIVIVIVVLVIMFKRRTRRHRINRQNEMYVVMDEIPEDVDSQNDLLDTCENGSSSNENPSYHISKPFQAKLLKIHYLEAEV
ncbi:uncharacterized protein LOC141908782 isoform X2 [Tubulanus polymorphus]